MYGPHGRPGEPPPDWHDRFEGYAIVITMVALGLMMLAGFVMQIVFALKGD